jgi:hypothetical protein
MSRLIRASGAALLTIGIAIPVCAEPVSAAGQVMLNEAAQNVGDSACNDDAATYREGRPTAKIKEEHVGARGGPKGGGRDKILVGRRGGPKSKTNEDVGRAAEQAADEGRQSDCAPQAERWVVDAGLGIAGAPEAARTGRPKEKTKTPMDTSRVTNPAPATDPIAPIDAPEAARTGRPKERDPTPMDTSRTGRPKERDDSPHNRSNLLLPVLGGAAIAATVAGTSGGRTAGS